MIQTTLSNVSRLTSLYCLIFFFIYSVLNDAQAYLVEENIIGGEETDLGNFTYQVSLNQGSKYICGGSIIGEQHVITAAHCVTDYYGPLNESIKVVAGVNNLKNKHAKTRVEINVKEVYIPKEFNLRSKNRIVGDVAVLKLEKPFDLKGNPNLSKLQLSDPWKTYADNNAIVTGFGWNVVEIKINNKTNVFEDINGKSYGKLRFAVTNVLSNQDCLGRISSIKPINKKHICAQLIQRDVTNLEGVCSGDSGGPLVYDGHILIGVLSTSPFHCSEDFQPAVYTRVSEYLDFIRKSINHVKGPQIRYRCLKSNYENVNRFIHTIDYFKKWPINQWKLLF